MTDFIELMIVQNRNRKLNKKIMSVTFVYANTNQTIPPIIIRLTIVRNRFEVITARFQENLSTITTGLSRINNGIQSLLSCYISVS